MKRFFSIIIVLLYFSTFSFAQMWNGVDSLFGNEWIQYEQQYFKMLVAEDGIYRVDKETLEDAGVPLNSVNGAQLRVYHMGIEIPVFASNSGTFSNQDYIEFYGKKNRGELDYHVFGNPEADMMNPRYSLYTDTSAYFLTWDTENSNNQLVETDNNLTNLPPKETAYLEELKLDFFNTHSKEYGGQNVKNSYFETAEGFGSPNVVSQSFTLNPTNPASGNANLYIRYATDYGGADTMSNGIHKQLIRFNGEVVKEDNNTRFLVYEHNIAVGSVDLANPIEVSFEGTHSNKDKQSVANLHLTYPRLFDFEGDDWKYFTISNSTGVKYLEIENFNINGETILYDLTNRLSITPTEDNGILKIALPPSATERELILVNRAAGVQAIEAIESITFIDYQETGADYFIVSHPILMQPDNQGINRVGEYADYRASAAGGDFTPLVIDINQLYDQYSYGVARHPISIRNFANKLRKIGNLPEYFFLVGKAREYQSYRTAAQINDPDDLPLLVPTFGWPASDRMLLSDNFRATPLTAIGRLPASTTEDIRIYLNKVREFEDNVNNPSTIEDRAWMKRIIHLGGGSLQSEQITIREHLEGMENIIENNLFGADVRPFYRTNTNPVELSTNELVFENINNGVSSVVFFGHAGANSFGYNIDNMEKFENKGKYPFLFALGCSVGNIHTKFKAVGERFVFGEEDKGMIAFIASSSFGFISALDNQMDKTYDLLGNEMYGASIGKIMREVTQTFDTHNNILTQQNTLNGDPALKVISFEGPDVVVDPTSVKFNPTNVHTDLNDFDFSFDIVNVGKGQEDSITLKIQQVLSNSQIVSPITARVKTPLNRETFTYQIPTYGKPSVGLNKMLVALDTQEELDELPAPNAELNNNLVSSQGIEGIPFFIQDNGIDAAYPPEFAIVNKSSITLVASTSNALATERKYLMQIDTTENFDSPFLKEQQSTQIGGLFKWTPTIDLQNEQVYYWRVSPDSISPLQGFVWSESSFIYLEDSELGWNQSDYGQWEKNIFEDDILLDEETEKFRYIGNFRDVRVTNKVWESGNPPLFDVDGNSIGCPWPWVATEGVQLMVIDPVNYPNWFNQPAGGAHGSVTNNTGVLCPWVFETNTVQNRADLMDFVDNVVPDGWHIILYTIQRNAGSDYKALEWAADSVQLGRNLFSYFEGHGATKIRELETKGSVPYVFMFQKGKGAADEAVAVDITGSAVGENAYTTLETEGSFVSKPVGPASEWEKLYWEIKDGAFPENDTVNISIIGLASLTGTETLLMENITMSDFSLASIDANQFPYLKLKFSAKDEIDRTVANLDYWRITYQGIPEFAVNPVTKFEFYSDTLQQGDIFRIQYAIENISDFAADSLLIRYNIINSANESFIENTRIEALEQFEETATTFEFNTRELTGIQNILVELNPEEDQQEITHINNFINGSFFVERDKRNPLLNVTFDGIHIMDGDLISPEPIIVINLKDENEFLELADTSLFNLFINYPDESEPRKINFSSESINFIPASLNGENIVNEAKIEYTPLLENDGTYTLSVEARDATGNQSGDLDYSINFEVINKSMISNIINYPNPFSTSTQFVYTMTGKEPPVFFKIQIMTVSGRIVREITQDEIGPLRTGTHKTDYAWDGTDEFGDKLANGIYLYRFTAQNGDRTDFETFETGADKFVKKGFGKMVLIR